MKSDPIEVLDANRLQYSKSTGPILLQEDLLFLKGRTPHAKERHLRSSSHE